MNRYLRSLLFASALGFNGSVVGFAGDKWTDSSGTKTIEADFVKLDGIQLTIKKSDGKEIVIPLYKLDSTSRLLARKLAKTPRSTASASSSSQATGKNTQHRFEQFSFPLPERFQPREIPGTIPADLKLAAFVDLSPEGTSNALVSMSLLPNKDGASVNMRQQLVNFTAGTANGMKLKIASRGKNEISEWNGLKFTHFPLLVSMQDGNMVGGTAYGTVNEDKILVIAHIAFTGDPPQIIDEIKDCIKALRVNSSTPDK